MAGRRHRRRSPALWVLLFVGGFVLAAAGAALAYFLVTVYYADPHPALADAATLSAPTNVTVTETGATTVTVSWTSPPTQLSGASYEVSETTGHEHDNAPQGGDPHAGTVVCPSPATSPCKVSGLSPGTTYTFSVFAVIGKNWQSQPASTAFTTLAITTTSLPSGKVNESYHATLTASGGVPFGSGHSTYYTWKLSKGTLPTGVTLTSKGILSGKVTSKAMKFSGLVFKVTDKTGATLTTQTLSINIEKQDTDTFLGSSSDPAVTGQGVTFTANVDPPATGPSGPVTFSNKSTVATTDPPSGYPMGPVTFTVKTKSGATVSCAGTNVPTLTLGQATCTVPTVLASAGPYTVSASYPGDTSFGPSAGTLTGGQTVDADATTTVLTSSSGANSATDNPGVSVTSQNVTYAASVAANRPGSGTPGGSVTFTAAAKGGKSTTLCATVLLASGQASCADGGAFLASKGPYTVTATYSPSGAGNYKGSSAQVAEDVNPAPTQLAIAVGGHSAATVTYGQTATLSGSGLPPSAKGTVTFSSSKAALCSFSTPTTTSCTTSSSLGAGSYAIAGTFTDTDGNYLSSTSTNAVALTVDPAPTSFSVSVNGAAAATITSGTRATLAASGLPSGAQGTVSFFSSSPAATLCSFSVPAHSKCLTTPTPGPGAYSGISASFRDATGNYLGSTSTNAVSLSVVQPPSITSGPSASFTAGVPGSVTVTTSGYPTPTLGAAGTLPSWLSFVTHHNGTVTVSGTAPLGTHGTYGFTILASNGVTPNATQPFAISVATPVVGLAFVDVSGGVLTCGTRTPTQVTCTDTTLGPTGTFSAKVELVNAQGSPVANTTGGTLAVNGLDITVATPGATLVPVISAITAGQSASTTAFSLTGKGTTWKATLVLTVTLGGRTLTIAVTAS